MNGVLPLIFCSREFAIFFCTWMHFLDACRHILSVTPETYVLDSFCPSLVVMLCEDYPFVMPMCWVILPFIGYVFLSKLMPFAAYKVDYLMFICVDP